MLTAAACGPAQKQAPQPGKPVEPAAGAAARPQCTAEVRRVSSYGRGAARPQIVAGADAFAVAWEETTDHRSVRAQTFGLDARPLGPSLELADLARAGSDPRLAAMPDPSEGFAVFWSTEQGDTSVIAMRRLDRAGKPKGDAVPVVTAAGARSLGVTTTESGFTLAWWNWTGTPHQVTVSFVDKLGRIQGRPVPITLAPSPDPTVDIRTGGALGRRATAVLAWDETIDRVEHVMVGELANSHLEGRIDFGPGETPRLGAGVLLWERAEEQGLYVAPLGGGAAKKLTDGHLPAAAGRDARATAVCFLHSNDISEEAHVDELQCGDLVGGKIDDLTRIAMAPRGIFSLQLAVGAKRLGVTWQSQEEEDTGVSFASVSCPPLAAAAKAPK
jgi:hypothetical protein